MQRRQFLIKAAYLTGATLLPLGVGFAATVNGAKTSEAPLFALSEPEDRVLAATLDHLFPASEEAPGARDIHAKAYLLHVFRHPGTPKDEREFLREGLHWLNDLAVESYSAPFDRLTETQRESVLRNLSTHERGERWLSALLAYTFEACFGDPVYGGNPDGIGWRWIAHHPGFPRPHLDKLYG